MRMKTKHALVLASLTLIAVPLIASGDAAAAMPSPGEVFSTVEFPDYGVGDFFSDLFGLGSALSGSGSALGGFTDFISKETFLNPAVGLSSLSSKFFLACVLVMVACVLMAVVSMYLLKREHVGQ